MMAATSENEGQADVMQIINLHDVLPGITPSFNYTGDDAYWKCERDVLTPSLEAAGFRLAGGWRTGERDSFGPLSRYINATDPEGVAVQVVYG